MSDSFFPTVQQQEAAKVSFEQNDLLCSLFYLSNLSKDDMAVQNERIKKNIDIFTGFNREFFISYSATFDKYGSFPDFFQFVASSPILQQQCKANTYIPQSLPQFQEFYERYMSDSEMVYIQSLMSVEQNREKKKGLIKRLETLMTNTEIVSEDELVTDESISILEETTRRRQEGTLRFPVAHFNDILASIGPGSTLTIMGPPGSCKTTLAENIVFLNSVLDNKNTLYFYLEDMPQRYQYGIFSRYTYHTGDKIPAYALKVGIDEGDLDAIKKVKEVEEKYQKDKRGKTIFVSMSQLSNDPAMFGQKLAKMIVAHKIDIVITDYIQKVTAFRTKGYSELEYLNQMISVLNMVSLGQYGSPPVVSIMLSQLNRDAEQRVEKKNGKMSLFDILGSSLIEQISFVVLGIYSSAQMREDGTLKIQALKNRDYVCDTTPEETNLDLQYCYVGDLQGLEDTYTPDVANSQWEKDFGSE